MPQLHTRAVVFNVTETADGNTYAVQPQELYKTQQYADGGVTSHSSQCQTADRVLIHLDSSQATASC